MNNVNLNKCIVGDILISKHGIHLKYCGLCEYEWAGDWYPHKVQYPDGSYGTRTDDGHVYKKPKNRMPEDHDIVNVISRNNDEY